MFKPMFALQSPEGDESRSGAPASGELKEGDPGYVPPSGGDKTITESQLKAILRSANEKYDRLANEFADFKAQRPKTEEAPKRYTRAELNAAVEAKQITVDQADEIVAKQLREEITADVTKTVLSTVGSDAKQGRVGADLSEYKKLAPEILDEESDARQKIAGEFRYLVETGLPNNLTTELAAIRAVLGPLEKLKVARSARGSEEFHEESGGGGEGRNHKAPKTLVETLTAREKDYYDGMIKKGMYKDWKAVEAELAFSRPDVRRKAGARV